MGYEPGLLSEMVHLEHLPINPVLSHNILKKEKGLLFIEQSLDF